MSVNVIGFIVAAVIIAIGAYFTFKGKSSASATPPTAPSVKPTPPPVKPPVQPPVEGGGGKFKN